MYKLLSQDIRMLHISRLEGYKKKIIAVDIPFLS